MEQSQMMSDQEKQGLAGDVMDSLGNPQEAESNPQEEESSEAKDELPKVAKERLGRQEKRHQKELRDLRSQIAELHNRFGSQPMSQQQQPANTYNPQPIEGEGIESHIHRAVNAALQAKDEQERKAKEMQSQAYVQEQYQGLQDHLDNASDKYDDFDEVVRNPKMPYTSTMRDTALLLPNAADVLYKIGKNQDELKRISDLHPFDQAKEMVKLSLALQQGGSDSKGANAPRQLGSIKSNPVNPSGPINENTPVGELRRKLKAGWK